MGCARDLWDYGLYCAQGRQIGNPGYTVYAWYVLAVSAKSAVDRPSARAFLGFSFTAGPTPQRVVSPTALARFKLRVRELTRRTTRVRFTRLVEELSRYLVGWRGYFGFCEDPYVLQN